MSLSTPVAFFIFNRPDLTEIVFDAIAKAQPKKLLVVGDGSRFPEEAEKCEKARAVINKVDWDCEVLTNFSENNLGCKYRVSSGLDWVFSEVEEAIILEDDCLPAPSFFYFCQTLLERYRYDERIMMISGDNFQPLDSTQSEYSYYFSKYVHIWGWASWRRAWQHYDVNMKTWPEYKKLNMISLVCQDPYEQKFWNDIFERAFEGAINTWDFAWVYTCWNQNSLSIMPNVNLVSNIGFRSDATHTLVEEFYANLKINDIWQIQHPLFIVRNKDAETYTFDYIYKGKEIKRANTISAKIGNKINLFKRLLKALFKKIISLKLRFF